MEKVISGVVADNKEVEASMIAEKRSVLKEIALDIIEKAKTELRELTDLEKRELEEIEKELADIKEVEANDEEKPAEAEDRSEPEPEEEKVEETAEPEKEEKEDSEEERAIQETKTTNISTKKMNKEFRLLNAIRDIANNRSLDEVAKAVAHEGAEEMRKSGLSYGGQIQIPIENRTIQVQTSGGVHEDIIETEFTNILEPLRAKNVLVAAGAKYMGNLIGDVQVPVMSKTNVGWAGELAEAASGDPTFNHVTLSPKRLTAYIDLSKQFLAQDSLSAEALIREDIVKAINNKLEETILGAGAGDTNTPAGMFSVISATSVSGFADVCDLEADLEDANVYGDKLYVMSNKAKAAFRVMPKSSKTTQLVMENGEIDGTKVINTSMIADKKYLYGDFSNLAIGQWGSIDLTVDPYTLARAGQVRIVVNAYFDCKILRPEAFVAGTIA